MQLITVLLLAIVTQSDAKKTPAPAKVTITAETACGHCTFGLGDSCALCLKLDDVTPILLEGKASEQFFDSRLNSTLIVVEGTAQRSTRVVLQGAKFGAGFLREVLGISARS